jgi:adenylate cyclase
LSDERVERRLAAVLAADVAGYSRLMRADEEGVLARLKAARKSLVDPTIAAHRGRIVKRRATASWSEFIPNRTPVLRAQPLADCEMASRPDD